MNSIEGPRASLARAYGFHCRAVFTFSKHSPTLVARQARFQKLLTFFKHSPTRVARQARFCALRALRALLFLLKEKKLSFIKKSKARKARAFLLTHFSRINSCPRPALQSCEEPENDFKARQCNPYNFGESRSPRPALQSCVEPEKDLEGSTVKSVRF